MADAHAQAGQPARPTSGPPPDGPPAGPAPGDGAAPSRRPRRWLLPVLLVLGLSAAGYGVYRYIWGLSHEHTDDAQVEGHVHPVASRVPGYVAEVLIKDNELVAAGQVLARIQPDDYQAQVALAEARLAQARAEQTAADRNIAVLQRTTEAAIAQARAGVSQAEAQAAAAREQVDSARSRLAAASADEQQAQAQASAAQAELDYAQANYQRVADLSARHQAAEIELQRAETSFRSAQAAARGAGDLVRAAAAQVAAARNAVAAATAAVQVAEADIAEQEGKLAEKLAGPDQVELAVARAEEARAGTAAAQAQLALARLNLSYCTITAPADGFVSRRSIEVGQYVQPGQPFLAVVPLDRTWVVANFKETQLREMEPGQAAALHVDAYPDRVFRGRIDSISAGTGARFSLLPPENATGNYVKIVQRVPVKIVLEPGQRDPAHPLRAGMNVEVVVRTRPARGEAVAAEPGR